MRKRRVCVPIVTSHFHRKNRLSACVEKLPVISSFWGVITLPKGRTERKGDQDLDLFFAVAIDRLSSCLGSFFSFCPHSLFRLIFADMCPSCNHDRNGIGSVDEKNIISAIETTTTVVITLLCSWCALISVYKEGHSRQCSDIDEHKTRPYPEKKTCICQTTKMTGTFSLYVHPNRYI